MTNSQKNEILIVLSIPRSGTTQLASSLDAYPGLHFFGEIFHNGRKFNQSWQGFSAESKPLMQAVAAQLGAKQDASASEVTNVLQREPVAAVQALAQADFAEPKIFGFKVFPNHMSIGEFARVLEIASCRVVLMERAPIDCYISLVKARSIQAWKGVDTTSAKPSLSVDSFLEFWSNRSRFLRATAHAAAAKAAAFEILRFDAFYDPHSSTLAEAGKLLNRLGLAAGEPAQMESLPRQDKAPDRPSKVANWPEFIAGIEQRQATAKLDDFGLQPPMGRFAYHAVALHQRWRGTAQRHRGAVQEALTD